MQKLFENWRGYRKEVLNEVTGMDTTSDWRVQAALGSETAKAQLQRLEDPIVQEHRRRVGLFLSLFDLTGITAYPHVLMAYQDYQKEKTYGNAGWLALSILSALPVIGAFAAPAKVGTVARTLKLAKAAKVDEVTELAGEIAIIVRPAKGNIKGVSGAELAAKIEKHTTISVDAASIAMRALDEAFKSGVIGFIEFANWFKKIKPNANRTEILEAFDEVKKIVDWAGKGEYSSAANRFAADHQFYKVMKKYNVEIDPSDAVGGWMDSLASAAPQIWDKYLKKYGLIPGAKIPSVAVGIAVKSGAITHRLGKNFFHALFHEIGHVELLKRIPDLAKPFFKEYRVLIRKQMDDIAKKYNLQPGGVLHTGKGKKIVPEGANMKEAEDLYRLWVSWGANAAWDGGAGLGEWSKLLKKKHFLPLDKASKRKIIAALQYKILKETEKAIRVAEATGDMSRIMRSGTKNTLYGAFQDIGPISQGLGMRQWRFYFLQFEEVAAELFEKAVRKRMGQHRIPPKARPNLRSERFPETIKIFQNIVDEEIGKLIKESINSYHMSIRKINILIG